jgi:hypothetical protein
MRAQGHYCVEVPAVSEKEFDRGTIRMVDSL